MKAVHFRDLLIWQRSMKLTGHIYALTATLPRSETFGLSQQMRRAAVSVPSNIAEGHGRVTGKTFAQFLRQARGSQNELETQTELCIELGLVGAVDCTEILKEIDEVSRMITAFGMTLC
jgi:four helix bundle protein